MVWNLPILNDSVGPPNFNFFNKRLEILVIVLPGSNRAKVVTENPLAEIVALTIVRKVTHD